MTHKALNWHPWGDNPIDHVGEDFVTPDGRKVRIERQFVFFSIFVDGEMVLSTDSNAVVCGTLYDLEAGVLG